MAFEGPPTRENKEENATLELLKKESLDLSHLAFVGTESTKGTEAPKIKPETWNENDGVIVYADKEGRAFAAPASEWARNLLQGDGSLTKDESIGVPHLNNKEVWGTEQRREGMPSFQEWQELAEKRLQPLPEK